MCNDLSLQTKAKGVSLLFAVLAIILIVFFIINPQLVQDKENLDFKDYLYIILPALALLSNLLMYQAFLDISSSKLYYWPDPKYCFLWWILVHSASLIIFFLNMTFRFWSLVQEALGESNSTVKNSNTVTILLVILFALGQTVILVGMKIVSSAFRGNY